MSGTTVVKRQVRIDHPGDGDRIMALAGGVFSPESDHSFATHRAGRLLGGLVMGGNLQASIQCHMGGDDPRWITRDLLWMAFDFAFNQIGVRKVIGPVPSTNARALAIDLRAGFKLEAIIRDATPGGHLYLLTMSKADCRWLKHQSRAWKSGGSSVG